MMKMPYFIPQPKYTKVNDKCHYVLPANALAFLHMQYEEIRLVKNFCGSLPDIRIKQLTDNSIKGFVLAVGTDISLAVPDECIYLSKDKKDGYYLRVDSEGIRIYSAKPEGLFYGMQTLYQLLKSGKQIPYMEITDYPDVEIRCMYFDLRQFFPRFDKMISYIKLYAKFKVNALVIEYEDKLPFTGNPELRHKQLAFSEDELNRIKDVARDNFIELIPLQQTFGHLEYVLKHSQYEFMREKHEDISTICPLAPGAFDLLKGLLSEVMDRHSDSRYIHIGCDEVYSFCSCEACKKEFGNNSHKVFIYHVNKLIDYVASKGKVPIIWHDMIWQFSDEEVRCLDKRVAVAIWIYKGQSVGKWFLETAQRLWESGIQVIGAPSVNCFDIQDIQNYPVVERRIDNIQQWTDICKRHKLDFMISTNWAVSGSAGCAYGLFETTLYTGIYSIEKWWNTDSENDSFLKRFLYIFHGMDTMEIPDEASGGGIANYYHLMGSEIENVKENPDIIRIMQMVVKYETAIGDFNSLNRKLYRYVSFKEEEGERVAILHAYKKVHQSMEEAKRDMEAISRDCLPACLVPVYLSSRFCIYDILKEQIYDNISL